jgi:hypothetical protein
MKCTQRDGSRGALTATRPTGAKGRCGRETTVICDTTFRRLREAQCARYGGQQLSLDPPFNSQANYNVLFRAPSGEQSPAQIEAFEDTWGWKSSKAEDAFDQVMTSGNTAAADMLQAIRGFLKENDMMAYLAMMAVRILAGILYLDTRGWLGSLRWRSIRFCRRHGPK